MIPITFVHPDTFDDVVWQLSVKEHSPILEVRNTATAEAGDYIDPDVVFKGSYETTQIISNPLSADQIETFNLLRRSTLKGRPIDVDASNSPLIGYAYTAIREGSLTPSSLHGSRYFSFVLKLRIVGVIA